jgi:hypothetical protein
MRPIRLESTGLQARFRAEVVGGRRNNRAVTRCAHLEFTVHLLSSGNSSYDRETLRRVDAGRYPTINGYLTAMKETEREGRYLLDGHLSFRSVT